MPPFMTMRPPRGLPAHIKSRITRCLLLGWAPPEIAIECHCCIRTVYNIAMNMLKYGSPRSIVACPRLGRPRKLTMADEEALLENLLTEGWMQQQEMAFWLWCERGAFVSRSTVSRILKRRKWTQKELRCISLNRSDELRREYREDMRQYSAEDIVFLDESIFKEQTGWRTRGYAPIGVQGRYRGDVNRGPTWSICAAMTVDGYLPCTGVKQGYFSTPDFLNWIRSVFLPTLRQDDRNFRVIVLDNNSTHIHHDITQAIEAEGYEVRFLPPYSPDFNPIELSFSVLKAWIRRNYVYTRHLYDNFGDWLRWAVVASRCDRFAREQYRHAANGLYMEEAEKERFYAFLRQWEIGDDNSVDDVGVDGD